MVVTLTLFQPWESGAEFSPRSVDAAHCGRSADRFLLFPDYVPNMAFICIYCDWSAGVSADRVADGGSCDTARHRAVACAGSFDLLSGFASAVAGPAAVS